MKSILAIAVFCLLATAASAQQSYIVTPYGNGYRIAPQHEQPNYLDFAREFPDIGQSVLEGYRAGEQDYWNSRLMELEAEKREQENRLMQLQTQKLEQELQNGE